MNCNNTMYNLLSPITEESPSTRGGRNDAPNKQFISSLHGTSYVCPQPFFPHLEEAGEGKFTEMTVHNSHHHHPSPHLSYQEQWHCHPDLHSRYVDAMSPPAVASRPPHPYDHEHGVLQRVDSYGRSPLQRSDSVNNNSSNTYSRRHQDTPQDRHWITEMDHPSHHNMAFRGPVTEVHVVNDDRYVPYQYNEHYHPSLKALYMKEPPFPDVPSPSLPTSRILYMHDPADAHLLWPQGPQRQASTCSWEDTKPAAAVVPSTPPVVEVAPGVKVRLRGAVETHRAMQRGFFIATDCPCCTTTICCIENADYVVCPDCRVVSPVHEDATDAGSDGGVGLGVKYGDYLY